MMTRPMTDELPEHPASQRNREPILKVLQSLLEPGARVLEFASGTGAHAEFFAASLPHVQWQPSEVADVTLRSVAARVARCGLPNLAPPLELHAAASWPEGSWSAGVAINLVHIAPWPVTEQLLANAGRALAADGGLMVFYGPYRRGGEHTSEGNAAFDQELRSRGTGSGIRNLESLLDVAVNAGFAHEATISMPANNLSVVLRRSPG